jgi:hypothetical protein
MRGPVELTAVVPAMEGIWLGRIQKISPGPSLSNEKMKRKDPHQKAYNWPISVRGVGLNSKEPVPTLGPPTRNAAAGTTMGLPSLTTRRAGKNCLRAVRTL